MKKPKVSPVEAVKISYLQLAEESKHLKEEVADLGRIISGVEASLRRLGLNISAWHRIAGGYDEASGFNWSRDIGYTRVGNLWHIALREFEHEPGLPPDQTTYKFGEAPPWMCLEAIGKIPELLEELIQRTRDMRAQIGAKKETLKELATVLEELAEETATRG